MKILILGASSFSGASFAEFANARGIKLAYYMRRMPDQIFFDKALWNTGPCTIGDINNEASRHELFSLISDFEPDVIINFLALGMVAPSWEAPEDWFQTNTVSTAILLKHLAGEFKGRFIQFSTPEVFGDTGQQLVKEDFRLFPTTPYAISRAAAENYIRALRAEKGFNAVITRTSNVYGPGQQLYRLIPRLAICDRLSIPFVLDGGGNSLRNFIHIKDVARCLLALCERGSTTNDFHISGRKFCSIAELVDLYRSFESLAHGLSIVPGPERSGKDFAYMLDPSRAESELEWHPEINLVSGIEEVRSWVRNIPSQQLEVADLQYRHKR